MTPPIKSRTGAQPEIELAIIESDVHHLREQSDLDRRGFAARMAELRAWRERMETTQATTAAHLARANDTLARLEPAVTSLVAEQLQQRGAVRLFKWLMGCGLLLEAIRMLMEWHR